MGKLVLVLICRPARIENPKRHRYNCRATGTWGREMPVDKSCLVFDNADQARAMPSFALTAALRVGPWEEDREGPKLMIALVLALVIS